MPPRKQQRKRAATTTTGGPSSRRSRRASTINATRATQNAAPAVDLPPLATPRTSATPPAPSSGNVLSPEILQTLVSTVAAEVTRQMATMLPAQVPSPVPTPAVPAVPVMATEPRPSQTSSSNAAEVNNLVTGAIAAAHAGISGEPQLLPTIISPSTASSVEPTQLFHSAGLAIDSRVSAKLKGKIWDEEFIDFGSLLSNSANGNDKYQLSFLSSNGGLPASFCLEPAAKPKKILNIEAWLQAFHIFVGVYTQRYPVEAPALMKYGQTIQDLAARGLNWRFYDENFRFLRQTQRTLVPWGSIHGELWLRSQYSMTRKSPGPQVGQNNFAPKPRSPTAVPWGYCFKFHRGQSCTGCAFKHSCFKCQGNHRVSQCGNNFRGFNGKSPANTDRSAKSSTTNASKNSASN